MRGFLISDTLYPITPSTISLPKKSHLDHAEISVITTGLLKAEISNFRK